MRHRTLSSASRGRAAQALRPPGLICAAAALLLLAGCTAGPGLVSSTVTIQPTATPALRYDVPEMTFQRPADPLPDGPATLSGLYAKYGDASLETCRLEEAVLRCARFYPVALETAKAPQLATVDGQLSAGKLAVDSWQPIAWDEAASRAAAQAALAGLAEPLSAYDWSAIALPNYAESSAWFRWQPEEISATPLELVGYDSASGRVIWRGQGKEMPQQQHLVHRYPALYFFADPFGQPPVETFVTIEGYVEE